MKVKVAIEFELNVEMNKLIENGLDEFVEDFCKTTIEACDDICKEEGAGISLKYLDHKYTTDKRKSWFITWEDKDNEDNA